MAFKLKESMTDLITKGTVKTNYLDRKIDRWNNNTAKFEKYLKEKGFTKGVDYKIENMQTGYCKQKFIWLRKK